MTLSSVDKFSPIIIVSRLDALRLDKNTVRGQSLNKSINSFNRGKFSTSTTTAAIFASSASIFRPAEILINPSLSSFSRRFRTATWEIPVFLPICDRAVRPFFCNSDMRVLSISSNKELHRHFVTEYSIQVKILNCPSINLCRNIMDLRVAGRE